jgi:peptide/nickel transport system substrate-binding protein
MQIIRKKKSSDAHPYIPELKELYREGRISRREFLRNATLLGVSLATANAFLAACAPQTVEAPAEQPAADQPRYGGTHTIATRVQRVDHPARLVSIEGANAMRLVNEYLTFTDWDNITHPHLLDHWEANEDVDEWTLYLREGIQFNDGSDLTADDVISTMKQWFDDVVGSSTASLMSYLSPTNIERVDDYTVKLYLDSPQIGVPEALFHYPNLILPQNFEGDWTRQPIGTGPFALDEYVEAERAVFTRRDDYWRQADNGDQLPYLDQVVMLDLGEEEAARIAALQSGQVDNIFNPSAEIWLAVKDLPEINVYSATTAQTFVIRMRVDKEPFNDVRVRNALKMCVDR